MADCIDSQAREDIGKLYYRFGELAADYWGVNRDNGKRSVLVNLEQRYASLEHSFEHYRDVERRGTCLGLEEFRKRDEAQDEIDMEETEVKITKMNNGNALWIQILQLAGIFGVALIALLK